ncbi:Fatty-acid amide hydrolase 2 [Aphelenchoides fujianensis]|nr:Fatty-acid amide hydrolase 2 [Aphelenchoides fujianensis]
MLLDEREIVSLLLLQPLSRLLVWTVQWYFTLVRWAYLLWGLTQPKLVVTKAGKSADEQLLSIPAVDLAAKIRNGEIPASQLIEAYIHRIEVVDAQIHAVVQRNYEDARLQAKRIDEFLAAVDRESEEFRKLAEKKPLLGVPFSIKDQFFIKGLKATVGMVCFKELLATEDAVVVKKYYAKSRRVARGALIGAGGSVIGIGTDIAGSIRVPALMNGIFGLKPGPRLYPSLEGMVPNQLCGYQNEMFGMGPMARYAKDLMPVFKVSPFSAFSSPRAQILIGPENAKALHLDEPVDLSALRFYAMEGTSSRICSQPLDADVAGAFRKTVNHFGTVGRQAVGTVTFPLAQYAANYW